MTNRIPTNWEPADLVSVAVVTSGQSPPGSTYNTIGEGLPFFQGKAEFGDVSPTPVKWCSTPLKIAHPGDVLISVRAPVGPTNLADVECCIGRGLAAITPLGGMPSKFYFYYFRHSVEDLVRQATGTTFQAINGKQLRAHEVLVPPLPEQHRIVEAIESYLTRLDAAVASLNRVQKNLKRYRASVLKAAVEGLLVPTEAELAKKEGRSYEPASELLEHILVERRKKWIEDAAEKARAKAEEKARKTGKSWTHADNVKTLEKESAKAAEKYKEQDLPDINDLPDLPEGWCWASVEQIVDVGTGATPKRGEPRYWKDGTIPWVSSAVVNHPYVNEVAERVTETAIQETNLTVYSPGTLLVAMYGEGKTRGKATELTIESTTNQALAALVFTKASAALRRFLKLFMEHNYSSIRRAASGGVQPNLNLGIVKVIAVPLPPLAEQERVCTTVESLLSVGNEVERSAQLNTSRSMRFRQSILKWAFEGKLVEQDPNDEPASKLLERIKAERETMQPHKRRRANRQRSNEPTKHDEQLDLLEGNNT